jgi:hypothetical protein
MSAEAPESASDGADGPPATGDAAVDDALAGLAELEAVPLTEHYEHLARAHEVLRTALEAGSGGEPSTGGH